MDLLLTLNVHLLVRGRLTVLLLVLGVGLLVVGIVGRESRGLLLLVWTR